MDNTEAIHSHSFSEVVPWPHSTLANSACQSEHIEKQPSRSGVATRPSLGTTAKHAAGSMYGLPACHC